MVVDLAGEIAPGTVLGGRVARTTDHGALVQLEDYPSREAYMPVSAGTAYRPGDAVTVLAQGLDPRGRLSVRLHGRPPASPTRAPSRGRHHV
jgi:hypothetical protein